MRLHSLLFPSVVLISTCLASPTPTSTSGTPTIRQQEPFVHPGLLHTASDFDRIEAFVSAEQKPFILDWVKLNTVADLSYVANPHPTVRRGQQTEGPNNVHDLFHDAGAAYALAVRWKISGDDRYADVAARILDAWSSTLPEIRGPSDRFLASGLQGYQFANIAEILRGYAGWDGLENAVQMLVDIF